MEQFQLTLRRADRGGPRAREMYATRSAYDQSRTRLLLLIHGYNVPGTTAERKLEAFGAAMIDLVPQLRNQVGHLLWPGDWQARMASWASYPWKVETAISCARDLADYLSRQKTVLGWIPRIMIVAHSTGCRMVLEAMRSIPAATLRRVTVVMMAAAYPTELVSSLPPAVSVRCNVLYSEADWVLQYGFPIGERLAASWFHLPQCARYEAVGLRGMPAGGTWRDRKQMAGYGHGDYWEESECREEVCRILHLRGELPLRSRSLPTRELQQRE